jgi:hypothetical protein
MLHTLRFSIQNVVYFIMLPLLLPVLFTFYIQVCQNLNVNLRCQKVEGYQSNAMNRRKRALQPHQENAHYLLHISPCFCYMFRCTSHHLQGELIPYVYLTQKHLLLRCIIYGTVVAWWNIKQTYNFVSLQYFLACLTNHVCCITVLFVTNQKSL